DDGMTLPLLAAGGTGVISVAANVVPRRTVGLVEAALDNDYERARRLHHQLGPLFRALFVETNPIPVKEALHYRNDYPPHLRSPLSRLRDEHREPLRSVLDELSARPAPAEVAE
ncbi:MAG: dihydrodipicolinate synthase family protein, partial [Halobacteriales archaeon]